MAEFDEPAAVQGSYTPEMQTEMERIARLITEPVDLTRAPDDASRQLNEKNSAIWNTDPPPVASVRHLRIPADASFDAAPCDAVVYQPENAGDGIIFFVHGGGWSYCSLPTYDRFMRVLCNEAGRTVVGVHYRLAPEHPFPAALHDVVSAFRAVLSRRAELGLPEGPVVIAGDSAGGNIALGTMLHEINAGSELPIGGILIYGAFWPNVETPSCEMYADGHLLTRDIIKRTWGWYVPEEADRRNPLAAPLYASDAQLRALPPLLLVVAEVDPLASDSYILKQRLDDVGRVGDAIWVEHGVVHAFILMTATLEAARRAVREAAAAANRFMAGMD